MKKTLCVIIAVIIALSSMTVIAFAGAPDITMTADKTDAKPGDVITVTVKVAKGSNLASATLDVVYDKACFEIVKDSMKATEAMGPTINENYAENKARYIGTLEKFLKDEAVLFTIQFKVLKRGGNISIVADEVYYIDTSSIFGERKEVTDETNNNMKDDVITIACPHSEKTTNVVSNASCHAEGKKEEICKECGMKTEITIEKLPHELRDFVTKAPTCEEAGTKVQQCSKCDYISESIEIPATGHTEGEWKVVKLPTTKEAGLEEKKCTVCGKVLESREIPMIVVYTLGDVNNDGYITAVDARLVLRSVAELVNLNPIQSLAADVNKDGKITAVDARLILQYVAGTPKF